MTGREGRRRALRRRWRGYRCQRKCARTTGSRDKAREGREGSGRQRAGSAGKRTARIHCFFGILSGGWRFGVGALVVLISLLYQG